MFNRIPTALLSTLIAASAVACGEDDEATPTTTDFTVNARAVDAEGNAVACDADLALGGGSDPVELQDLRFYVSEPVALLADGTEVALEFVPDGAFQSSTVALVDLEDATGRCENGTSELHAEFELAAVPSTAVGLAFTVGVPFDENHQDVGLADSPLNLAAMFWNWQGGYKFIRGEFVAGDATWNLHLGSTGCDGTMRGDVTTCMRPNRLRVTFDEFAFGTDGIELDLGALLAGVDLTVNTADTPAGCMSGPTNPECPVILDRLGVPLDGESTTTDVIRRTTP